MTVTLNGTPRELTEGTTVAQLVAALGRGEETLAVAVNLRVVPRSEFADRRLMDGDRVDVVTAVGPVHYPPPPTRFSESR